MEYIIAAIIAAGLAFWIRKGVITRAWYDAQVQKLIELPNGRRQLVFRSLPAFNKTSDAGFDFFMNLKLIFARSTTTAQTSLMDLESKDGFQIQNRLLLSTRCWHVGDDKQKWISAITCESYCMPLWWKAGKKTSLTSKLLFLIGIKASYGNEFMPKPRGLLTTEADLEFMLDPKNWSLIDVEKKSHAQRVLTTIEIARRWKLEEQLGQFKLTQPEQLDLSAVSDLSVRIKPIQIDWSSKKEQELLRATGIEING